MDLYSVVLVVGGMLALAVLQIIALLRSIDERLRRQFPQKDDVPTLE